MNLQWTPFIGSVTPAPLPPFLSPLFLPPNTSGAAITTHAIADATMEASMDLDSLSLPATTVTAQLDRVGVSSLRSSSLLLLYSKATLGKSKRIFPYFYQRSCCFKRAHVDGHSSNTREAMKCSFFFFWHPINDLTSPSPTPTPKGYGLCSTLRVWTKVTS